MKKELPHDPYVTAEGRVPVADVPDRWELKNPSLAYLNKSDVRYKVISAPERGPTSHAVFYLPGMGGALEDTAFLEDRVCLHSPLVRVECFGLRHVWADAMFTTFGDLCTLLRTGRQCVSLIADRLGLDRFDMVGHSWGGMIGLQTAMNDARCRHVMPLVSTPDVCDAMMRMYFLVPTLPSFTSLLDLLQAGHIRREAEAAKFGRAEHQAAWDAISTWHLENYKCRGFATLIYNRAEDPIMRRENVEHWLNWALASGLDARAEFLALPANKNPHDMPLTVFGPALERFFWGGSTGSERVVPFPVQRTDSSAATA